MDTLKDFPNGFTSWYETFFEIASAISHVARQEFPRGVVAEVQQAQGTGGLYELAEELTDKFEALHTGRHWDGEFFDELEVYMSKELFEGK